MAEVTYKGVKKVYQGNVTAVDDFNLKIEDKEFIVLVGPSGCGKTTVLRMTAGLIDITEGELYIDDRLVNNVAPKDRDIAMVFQNYALYPHMTVFQNMAFSLTLHKEKKPVIQEKVKRAADILGIGDLMERTPKELSGGQRQRVAIGRAIVRNPKVFLMDEPLSNLDAKLRNQMRAELIKLRQAINTTFIYVTHDQVEAMTLADRIVVMNNKYIQQIGTPQEIFEEPVNLFVAGFIGSPQMNFVDASLVIEDGDYYVTNGSFKIRLPEKRQAQLKENGVTPRDVIFGVRPEHMTVSKEEAPENLKATIDVSELMGSTIHLHTNAYGKDFIVVLQTADLTQSMRDEFNFGYEIKLKANNDMIYVFDKETEKSLYYKADEE